MLFAAARFLGMIAWGLCLVTLGGQAVHWLIHGSWPTLTAARTLHAVFGLDALLLLAELPFQTGLKLFYLLMTMELAAALWWLGAAFFGVAFLHRLFFR